VSALCLQINCRLARIVTLPKIEGPIMSGFKEPSFADRQKTALDSKRNILKKFHAKPGPDDPAVLRRQAEREAHATKRVKAKAARDATKVEQKSRAAEEAALAVEQLARDKADAAAKEIALEAQRKAARDARYASRKKAK
jgi:hypothetical protein